MSRLITLDIDSNAIHVLSGTGKGASARPDAAATYVAEQPLGAGTAALIGKGLKEFLKARGLAGSSAVVVVGRERIILKDLKFPPVPIGEEPTVVRFQASKEHTESLDGMTLDYVALDDAEPDGQRKALTVSMKKEYLEAIEAMCQAAGLTLAGVIPRPFTLAPLMQRTFAAGAVTPPSTLQSPYAVVTRGERWGEMAILKGGQLLFSRSISGPALHSENAFVGEVRRNLTAFAGQSPQATVERLYIAEAEQPGSWAGRLGEGLAGVGVQSFDPLAGAKTDPAAGPHGAFAALSGALPYQGGKDRLPLNLASPRQAIVAKDPNKRAIGFVALLFGLATLAVVGGGVYIAKEKNREVVKLRAEKDSLESQIGQFKTDLERSAAVEEWKHRNVNWLDELYDLTARFPDIDRTQATKLSFTALEAVKGGPTPAGGAAKAAPARNPGRILIDLVTEYSRSVDALQAAFVKDGHYKVEKETKGGAQGAGLSRLNQQYTIKAEVQQRTPADYKEKLVATPPGKAGGGRAGGGTGGFGERTGVMTIQGGKP